MVMSSDKSAQLVRLLAGLDAAEIKRGTRNKIVAEKTGYSLDSVKRILSGNSALTSRFIQAVCSVFKINSDWVLLANEPVLINEQADILIPSDNWSGQLPAVFEGRRLRELREILDYNYEEMAQQLNIGLQALHQHEKEIFISDRNLLRKLALLGVNINWLMTGRGEIRLNVWPIIISKQNAATDGWGRNISVEYKIDDLFITRLKVTLAEKSIDKCKLSVDTQIRMDRINAIFDNSTIPTFGELEAISRALGNINPCWLATNSSTPGENWEYEYYKTDDAEDIPYKIYKLCESELDKYIAKLKGLVILPSDIRLRIIGTLGRIYIKEAPDADSINKEILPVLVNEARYPKQGL